MAAVAQESARESRGQAELEIRFRAQLPEVPLRKLAAQKQAEALAENQLAAAPAEVGAVASAEVDQVELALPFREALHREFQTAGGGLFDAGDAAREIARAIPGLEGETLAAQVESEVVAGEGKQVFPGFEHGWLSGILEERLNFRARLGSAAHGDPAGGRHGNRIVTRRAAGDRLFADADAHFTPRPPAPVSNAAG